MSAPRGTLIAYATAPGSTASDGSGKNGLYTSAILESIQIPNLTILQMFQNVRNIVGQKSENEQILWESTSLTGDFYLFVNNSVQDNIHYQNGTTNILVANSITPIKKDTNKMSMNKYFDLSENEIIKPVKSYIQKTYYIVAEVKSLSDFEEKVSMNLIKPENNSLLFYYNVEFNEDGLVSKTWYTHFALPYDTIFTLFTFSNKTSELNRKTLRYDAKTKKIRDTLDRYLVTRTFKDDSNIEEIQYKINIPMFTHYTNDYQLFNNRIVSKTVYSTVLGSPYIDLNDLERNHETNNYELSKEGLILKEICATKNSKKWRPSKYITIYENKYLEFDKSGNWTQRIRVFNNGIHIDKREYKY
jgi:hypothetical protein